MVYTVHYYGNGRWYATATPTGHRTPVAAMAKGPGKAVKALAGIVAALPASGAHPAACYCPTCCGCNACGLVPGQHPACTASGCTPTALCPVCGAAARCTGCGQCYTCGLCALCTPCQACHTCQAGNGAACTRCYRAAHQGTHQP
jgi:hypothetical protein